MLVWVCEFDNEMVQHLMQISDVYEVMGEGGEDELYTEGGRVRGDMAGLLLLHPSPYSKRPVPLLGYFHIILAVDAHVSELYTALVDICVKITIDKSLGQYLDLDISTLYAITV